MNNSQWISVEDRLPDFEVPVQVISENEQRSYSMCRLSQVVTRKFKEGVMVTHEWHEGRTGMDVWYHEVTHWMPLPEPPKTDQL